MRTASISGRPARMNAPSWRERCMISTRLTRGAVISLCSKFFFCGTAMLVMSGPYHVDGTHHLGDRGDTGGHQPGALLLQRAHPLVPGELADLVVRCPGQDQLPDPLGDRHQLVDAGALQISG